MNILKGVFLVHFLFLFLVIDSQSPCPRYFRYGRDNLTGDVKGFIQIPNPPKNVALHLEVNFSVAVVFSSEYIQPVKHRIKLARSKTESVRVIQQGGPVEYYMELPLQHPIPLLTSLTLNKRQYCRGPRANGPVVSQISLKHSLYPPGTLNSASISLKNGFVYETDLIQEEDCGRSSVNRNDVDFSVANSNTVLPGEWPWVAAIFIVRIIFQFKCTGTLISNRHVITAAHCLKLDKQTDVPPNVILVSLGRYKLRNFRQKNSVNREVANYIFHPDYKHEENGDSDLAILVLLEPVEYNDFIKPICLWSGPKSLDDIVGTFGFVVGWRRNVSDNSVSKIRVSSVPIVSNEDCLRSNSEFAELISSRTFCAGLKDNSGPCNGDSGSGLVIRDSKSERYQLRGIVSRSILDRDTMTCDLSEYIVYVDIAKNMEWIQQQIST